LNGWNNDKLYVYNTNSNAANLGKHIIRATLTTSNQAQDIIIETYKNGIKVGTETLTGDGTVVLVNVPDVGTSLDIYEFYFSSTNANITINSILIEYIFLAKTSVFLGTSVSACRYVTGEDTGSVLTVETGLYDVCPDIKLSDLFAGILKEFNLVCYGISADVYQVEPLDSWYQKGALIDISKHVEATDIEVSRAKLFKRVSFAYAESKSFLNRQFKKSTEREYGEKSQDFLYDGEEYKIEVPFENLLFSKFTGTNLQVGYTLEEAPDFKPYTPKPILLYKYGNLDCEFKFNNDVTPTTITQYNAFGQDAVINGAVHTLNFNAEISTITNVVENNTLFADYYFSYLTNLFNPKNRITNIKTLLPISILTGLRLNDRLIIRDKRFIINNMKSDLTTGEVDFELINDFRPTLADGTNIDAGAIANCMVLPVLLGNTYTSATLSTSTVGVVITPSTITEDTNVQICIPDKLEKQENRITEASDNRVTEDGDTRVTEDGYPQLIAIEIVYTGTGGALTTELTLIQI